LDTVEPVAKTGYFCNWLLQFLAYCQPCGLCFAKSLFGLEKRKQPERLCEIWPEIDLKY
jgi:hypothetical protein